MCNWDILKSTTQHVTSISSKDDLFVKTFAADGILGFVFWLCVFIGPKCDEQAAPKTYMLIQACKIYLLLMQQTFLSSQCSQYVLKCYSISVQTCLCSKRIHSTDSSLYWPSQSVTLYSNGLEDLINGARSLHLSLQDIPETYVIAQNQSLFFLYAYLAKAY